MSQSSTPAPTNIPYLGIPEQNPRDTFYRKRAPTTKDYSIYRVGDRWINRPSQTAYILVSKANGIATWTLMASAGGPILTINSQPPIAGDINFTNTGAVAIGAFPGNITLGVKVDGVTVQIIGDQLVAGGSVPTTFVTDAGAAVPVANILNVIGTPSQGISTSGAGNTVTITAADATAVQKGVASFNPTNFTVAAGAVSSNPITVTSPLGTLTIGGSPVNLGGALTIDLAGGSVGADSFAVQASTAPGTNPVVPTGLGLLTINGADVAAQAIPVQSNSIAANTLQIEVQRASQQAASLAVNAGLASFDSSMFVVDANGFVQLAGGSVAADSFTVDAFTAPGTNPVVPTGLGNVTVNGVFVLAGGIPVQTNSIAANAYRVEVQLSSAQALSATANAGLSSFDNTQFTVDANGWVQMLNGLPFSSVTVDSVVAPGVNPVTPDALGNITVAGTLVPTGTNVPIQTISNALNTYEITVQIASAVAVSDPAQNGMCHFDSADFTVDANGFVSAIGGTSPWLDSAGGALVNHTGYFATAAAAYTLPAGVANGDMIEIIDSVGGGIVVTASGADIIQIQNTSSTAGGTATSTQLGDSLRLVFRLANLTWFACPGAGGNWLLA